MRRFTTIASKSTRFSHKSSGSLQQFPSRHLQLQSVWTQSDIRRVQLRQPWINWKRIGLWTFYCVSTYGIYQYLLNRIVDGLELEDEDTVKDAQGEEEEDEDEDEDEETVILSLGDEEGSFVPVQTPKQLPRQNYKQSDPEWQEFVKLSRDSDRQKAARQELSDKLVQTASTLKPLRQKLGKDIKWTKSWLDFTYPDQAAPEYIRQGWALLEDGALWSKQIMPHSQYVQMRHILWPKALFQAGKQSLKAFYSLQAIKFKNAMGVDLNPTEKQLQLASKVFLMQANAIANLKKTQAQVDQIKANVETNPQAQQQMQKQNPGKLGSPEDRDGPRTESAVGNLPHFQVHLPSSQFIMEVMLASRVFIGALAPAWKQSKLDTMPPGCCFLAGDVELVGSQGRCKLGVLAAYDPKANSFIWINSKPKGFWSHSQVAKGGP